jgi:hypothetical protein
MSGHTPQQIPHTDLIKKSQQGPAEQQLEQQVALTLTVSTDPIVTTAMVAYDGTMEAHGLRMEADSHDSVFKPAAIIPRKRKGPKKPRNRKHRVGELLLVLFRNNLTYFNMSNEELARECNTSASSISRALKHQKFKPEIDDLRKQFAKNLPKKSDVI